MEDEFVPAFKDIERTSKLKEDKSQIEDALEREIDRQGLSSKETELMEKFQGIPRLEYYNPVALVAAAKFVIEDEEAKDMKDFLRENNLLIPYVDMVRYIRFYESLP